MIQSIGRPYSKTHSHTYVGTVYRPRCRVSFHTDEALFSFEGGFPDPTNELISVRTQKSLSQPTGTMTITLAPREVGIGSEPKQDWFHRINPMDFVVVEMKEDISKPWVTVMVGFVDQVRENFVGGDRPQRLITITASDFGKVLTRCNADFFTQVENKTEQQQFIKTRKQTNLYMNADSTSPVVGYLQSGMQHEIVNQVGNYYYINAERFGYGYVYAGDVTVFTKSTAASQKSAELANLMQQLPLNINMGGNGTTGFFWDIILKGQNNVFVDPSLAMANIFVNWIYKVWNVATKIYTSKGAIQADLPSLLRFIIAKPINWGNVQWALPAASAYSGSMWAFLQSLAALPFGEMWVDIREDLPIILQYKIGYTSQMYDNQTQPTIQGGISFNSAKEVFVWRPVPFDYDDWTSITKHPINNKLIREQDIGKSDFEVINAYWVTPLNLSDTFTDVTSMIPVILDGQSAVKYGLQSFRVSTNIATVEPDAIKVFSEKLYQWYKDNPQFLEGTITIKGRPNIRIGQRLYNEDTGYSFYIESVSHNWTNYEEYTTTLEVSRGMIRND